MTERNMHFQFFVIYNLNIKIADIYIFMKNIQEYP